MSYDEVAAELGYANRSGAWKAEQASLKAVQADTVGEYRSLTIERLEALLAVVWPKAMTGDITAVAAAQADSSSNAEAPLPVRPRIGPSPPIPCGSEQNC